MEPLSLLAAAGAFLAAEAAKHVGGVAVEKAFDGLKRLFNKHFGRDPVPADFAPQTIGENRLDTERAFVEEAREVVARSSALRRAELVKVACDGATLLWVDDHPANNAFERQAFTSLGMRVHYVMSTSQALTAIARETYDVILSDMARDTPDAGLVLLRKLREAGCQTEVVFYVGSVDTSRPTPLGAFGMADHPEPLFHYVLDVLERHRV